MEPTAIRERATAALAALAIDARVVLLACILSIVATLAVVVRNVLPRLIGLVVRDATTTTTTRERETGRWSSPRGLLTPIASRASGRRARTIGCVD